MASTIGEILRRHGLTVPRKKRPRATPNSQPLRHATGANVVWCADFKGWFRCHDGSRCDPLTISDAYSRFWLRCQVVKHSDGLYCKPLFEAPFREYGLPDCLLIDHGAPFASVGVGGLSAWSVWWIKLGIRPERIEPGQPAQNGRQERMHRTLKEETAQPPRANLREQQKACDEFRQEYNQERPHAALAGKAPASCYQASPRPYPSRLEPVAYPADFVVRQVTEGGQIRWHCARVFVGRALGGELIGFEPIAEGQWRGWFSFYELGEFDEAQLVIRPCPSSRQHADRKDQKPHAA